jgi:Ni,Fe-hydrogenase III small subunit
LLAGAVNDTVAVVVPVAVAVPIVGVPGSPAGVAELLAALFALLPALLVAYTTNVYEVPVVNPLTIILPEPA